MILKKKKEWGTKEVKDKKKKITLFSKSSGKKKKKYAAAPWFGGVSSWSNIPMFRRQRHNICWYNGSGKGPDKKKKQQKKEKRERKWVHVPEPRCSISKGRKDFLFFIFFFRTFSHPSSFSVNLNRTFLHSWHTTPLLKSSSCRWECNPTIRFTCVDSKVECACVLVCQKVCIVSNSFDVRWRCRDLFFFFL